MDEDHMVYNNVFLLLPESQTKIQYLRASYDHFNTSPCPLYQKLRDQLMDNKQWLNSNNSTKHNSGQSNQKAPHSSKKLPVTLLGTEKYKSALTHHNNLKFFQSYKGP